MPATEIPPKVTEALNPLSPKFGASELYDAERWESAFRELHDAPNLIVRLQDDLSRSRQREAFWISVVVHLVIVLLVVNSNRLQRLIRHHPVVVVNQNDWMRQKDLTYLELPPDVQKLTKRPDTNIISDKNRIATSRSPHLDPKELKRILDSARAGSPGPTVPPSQQQAPAPASQGSAPQQQAPAQQAQQSASKPPDPTNQIAKLQTPPMSQPKPSFDTGGMSVSSAIDQAARAAAANRGGNYGGGGDYGFGQGRQVPQALGPMDVLSDTMGVDFGPYLARVLHDVRENWYRLIPDSAMPPLRKKGKVSIQFAILKDGKVAGMQLVGGSGDVALDRGAWGGITASNPFPPLPREFGGQYLELRFHFLYNPDLNELQ